jgi:hypothetical protein
MIQDTQKQNENNAGTDRFFLNKKWNFSQSRAICQLIVNKIKAAYNQSLIRSTRACLILCGIEIIETKKMKFILFS